MSEDPMDVIRVFDPELVKDYLKFESELFQDGALPKKFKFLTAKPRYNHRHSTKKSHCNYGTFKKGCGLAEQEFIKPRLCRVRSFLYDS